MTGSVNLVILVGNLGRDPEMRSTQDGQRIANLNIATSESWKDRSTGERKERTEWTRVVIFNDKLAEVAEKYCQKGTKVYVQGALQTRKWTDQQGQEKYTTEVVLQKFRGELQILSDGRSAGGGGGYSDDYDNAPREASGGRGRGRGSSPRQGGRQPGDDDDPSDEIPF